MSTNNGNASGDGNSPSMPTDGSVSEFLWPKLQEGAKLALLFLVQGRESFQDFNQGKPPLPEEPWKQHHDMYTTYMKPGGYTWVN